MKYKSNKVWMTDILLEIVLNISGTLGKNVLF